MRSNEIIVYGGAFNPPTLAHQSVINACLTEYPDSEIWVMPCGNRYDKSFQISNHERIQMVAIMIGEIAAGDRLKFCDVEINSDHVTQTIKTVVLLNRMYPAKKFRYVFGSDTYDQMQTWQNGSWLRRFLPMAIMPRGDTVKYVTPNCKILTVSDMPNISSTMVREMLKAGRSIDDMVCSSVKDYIYTNRLYDCRSNVA